MKGDLQLYKVFYTVACSKNISRAAELLYISQPAVSKSIKILEDHLGITLFVRNSRGVTLSYEGQLLYESVQKAFTELDIAEDLLKRLKNNTYGTITLGVSTTLGKNFLLPFLKSFIKEYPDFKIKIINKNTAQTLQLLKEGKMDLAIAIIPETYTDLNFIPLQTLQDILVASPSYLEKLSTPWEKNLFKTASFMLLEKPNVTRMHLQHYFDTLGITIKPDIEASNMDFLIECAKMGLGITSVIQSFVKEDISSGRLIEIPIAPPIPPRSVGIVYHTKLPLSMASKTFISFLQNTIC